MFYTMSSLGRRFLPVLCLLCCLDLMLYGQDEHGYIAGKKGIFQEAPVDRKRKKRRKKKRDSSERKPIEAGEKQPLGTEFNNTTPIKQKNNDDDIDQHNIMFRAQRVVILTFTLLILFYTMMSLGTRLYSHRNKLNNRLTALHLLLNLLMVSGQAEHEFNMGKNVTLDFHHELESPSSTYFCIAYHDGSVNPFYQQNQINSLGLKPGQAGRVDVNEEQIQKNVTITIGVHDVQPIDEGLYIVNIIELNGGTGRSYNYQMYLDVRYPPGRAECHIENPPFPIISGHWLTLRCNATVGNDNIGHLMCYQNSKQVPRLEPVRHIDNYMTGLFWIDSTLQVKCCSTYNVSDVDIESCNDFVWPSSVTTISDKPDVITTTWSPASPLIKLTDDDMDQHDGKARDFLVAIVMLGTLLGVCVVIQLATVYMSRKKKRKNNEESRSNRTTILRQVEIEDNFFEPKLKDHAPGQSTNGGVVYVNNCESRLTLLNADIN